MTLRESPIASRLAAPPPGGRFRDLEFNSMRVESLEPPAWFGAFGQRSVRIAGKVFGADRTTTVRLAINVPEPGIWPGRVVAVEPDGTFEFSGMRPGPYLLVAYGGDRVSQLTAIDTRVEPADRVELFAAPCQLLHGTFWNTSDRDSRDATPAVGVAVELAGWVLGVTDAGGAYDVCVPDGVDHTQLRVPGFADPPVGYRTDRDHHRLLWPKHLEEGYVLEGDGRMAVGVGVQPIWRTGQGDDDCRAAGEVRTTDSNGRFTYNGANRLCGFRILRGDIAHDQGYDALRFDDPQLLTMPDAGDEQHLFDAAFVK